MGVEVCVGERERTRGAYHIEDVIDSGDPPGLENRIAGLTEDIVRI